MPKRERIDDILSMLSGEPVTAPPAVDESPTPPVKVETPVVKAETPKKVEPLIEEKEEKPVVKPKNGSKKKEDIPPSATSPDVVAEISFREKTRAAYYLSQNLIDEMDDILHHLKRKYKLKDKVSLSLLVEAAVWLALDDIKSYENMMESKVLKKILRVEE